MLQELKKHKIAYTILVVGLLTGVTLFLGTWPNVLYQRIVILSLGIFYFCWGVATHVKTSFVTRQVILEYLGVSVLGMVVLGLLTI